MLAKPGFLMAALLLLKKFGIFILVGLGACLKEFLDARKQRKPLIDVFTVKIRGCQWATPYFFMSLNARSIALTRLSMMTIPVVAAVVIDSDPIAGVFVRASGV